MSPAEDLIERAERAEQKVKALGDAYRVDLQKLEEARAQLRLVAMDIDDAWRWQGDGYDHPESLSCPVVMSAHTLRAMLARTGRAEDMIRTLLASAVPHQVEHPTMAKAWAAARELLGALAQREPVRLTKAEADEPPPTHPKAIWGPARVWAVDPTWCAVERGGAAQVLRADGAWRDLMDDALRADVYQRALVDTLDEVAKLKEPVAQREPTRRAFTYAEVGDVLAALNVALTLLEQAEASEAAQNSAFLQKADPKLLRKRALEVLAAWKGATPMGTSPAAETSGDPHIALMRQVTELLEQADAAENAHGSSFLMKPDPQVLRERAKALLKGA